MFPPSFSRNPPYRIRQQQVSWVNVLEVCCMTYVPLADAADRERWLKLRQAGVTASEIAVLAGVSRYGSPLSLYYEKRGETGPEEDNDLTAIGAALEPYVLSRFGLATGLGIAPCGQLIAHAGRPWQLATPDALLAGDIVPVEAKTAVSTRDWGPAGSQVVPAPYWCQLQWQMDVLGAPYGYLAVVFRASGEFRWYEIARDDFRLAELRALAAEFLWAVEQGDPPETDGSEATARALRARYPPEGSEALCGAGLVRSYRAALRARERASERLRLAENRVRAVMGTAVKLLGPDGTEVAVRRVYERSGYEVKPATIDALFAGKGMKGDGN
jgi:putative phage-type endonuclease